VTLIRRAPQRRQLISLVPLVDVMMILLVFFMVTSTYLDLDMIPVVNRGDAPVQTEAPSDGNSPRSEAMLIRLGPDGRAHLQGRVLDAAALDRAIRARLAERADAPILILPSGAANLQALVSVLETATAAGATALRVVRLEASP
jgi:biopolymer transport protein ExbD